jgi:small subunit ribosomal protein S8
MISDPIADMLTRIRNANLAGQGGVEMPSSRIKEEIARVLEEEGYIAGSEVSTQGAHRRLRIEFKARPDNQRTISGLKRISRPGLRVYAGKDEVPRVLGGLGTPILSTSKGVISGRDAWKQGVGGEVLAHIW